MFWNRLWAVRHARGLHGFYQRLETALVFLNPLLVRIGHQRLDSSFARIEKTIKGVLFESQSCGQCTLGETGMVCPMNCPKTIRNGPCGGVRADGSCEVKPQMTCVWVTAWQGSQRLANGVQAIQIIQAPVDSRLRGTSAWLRAVRKRVGMDAHVLR